MPAAPAAKPVEAEHRGDQGDDEKHDCVVKHGDSSIPLLRACRGPTAAATVGPADYNA